MASSCLVVLFLTIPGIFFYPDSFCYDMYMRYFKKPITEDSSLVLIDIDDNALDAEFIPYRFPWPRRFHGDALEVFAEFGAKAVIFDIDFFGNSSAGVNINDIRETEKILEKQKKLLVNNFVDASKMVAVNPAMRQDMTPLWQGFAMQVEMLNSEIKQNIDKAVEDNDSYFAKRLTYFGRAYGTVNMMYDSQWNDSDLSTNQRAILKEDLEKFGLTRQDFKAVPKNTSSLIRANFVQLPIEVLKEKFAGVGFTKIVRDKDAAVRKIGLFMEKEGAIFPQLSLRPFLDIYGITPDQIDFSRNGYVIFNDVKIGETTRTIRIPVENGFMKINWPTGQFGEIFASNRREVIEGSEKPRHFSYLYPLYYKHVILPDLKEKLSYLADMEEPEAIALYTEFLEIERTQNTLVETITLDDNTRQAMGSFIDDFLEKALDFTGERGIKRRENEIDRYIDLIRDGKVTGSSVDEMEAIKKNVRTLMEAVSMSVSNTITARQVLAKNLYNKICFVGHTATGTTDLGSNPYDRDFENVGTHPSVFNTILQGEFIHISPNWIIFLLCLLLFSLLDWFIAERRAYITASIGFLTTLVMIIVSIIIYRFTNIYASPVVPIFYGLCSSFIMIALEFIVSENDKRFIRSTFSRYLSPIVINELLKDPEKIELGGERRICTAMFTDIEKFSAISELFETDPKGLVNLLNGYLSAMSDIVLNHGGTIDKYEGDAIIAFFGAPLDTNDHAFQACQAALEMKRSEKELNERLLSQGVINRPLFTRIGINTGEMFVGNVGTNQRLDYTIMGHPVNLASRLEGVNKQYGIYKLTSEYSYELIEDIFYCRRLDRVRVVNIKTPVRLYEPMALKNEASEELFQFITLFDKALTVFETQDWKEALSEFKELKKCFPDDKPIDVYIDRCKKFLRKPPKSDWDGVYTLTEK